MWKDKQIILSACKHWHYEHQFLNMAFLHLLSCCWKKNQMNSTWYEFLLMRTGTLSAYNIAISMNVHTIEGKKVPLFCPCKGTETWVHLTFRREDTNNSGLLLSKSVLSPSLTYTSFLFFSARYILSVYFKSMYSLQIFQVKDVLLVGSGVMYYHVFKI